MSKTKVKKIVVEIGGKDVEMTPEEAKALKAALEDLFQSTEPPAKAPFIPMEPYRPSRPWKPFDSWPTIPAIPAIPGPSIPLPDPRPIYYKGGDPSVLRLQLQ